MKSCARARSCGWSTLSRDGSRPRPGLKIYRDRLGHDLKWRNDELGQAGLRLPDSETELVLSTSLQYAPNWLVKSPRMPSSMWRLRAVQSGSHPLRFRLVASWLSSTLSATSSFCSTCPSVATPPTRPATSHPSPPTRDRTADTAGNRPARLTAPLRRLLLTTRRSTTQRISGLAVPNDDRGPGTGPPTVMAPGPRAQGPRAD